MAPSNIGLLFKPKTPKYLQIADYLANALIKEDLNSKEVLPSINYLSQILEVSRDTVEKAYKVLKERDCVEVIPGKGYFKKGISSVKKRRILLLFDTLSHSNRIIYRAFYNEFDRETNIDFFDCKNEFSTFEKIIQNLEKPYTHYLITANFYPKELFIKKLLPSIPKENIILFSDEIKHTYDVLANVNCQIEKNTFDILEQTLPYLKKYQKLNFIFPFSKPYSRKLIAGFQLFCQQYNIAGVLREKIPLELNRRNAYITLSDEDLASLVKKLEQSDLQLGKNVGMLSFYDNPLKEVILGGISTIIMNEEKIGKRLAQLVKENKTSQFDAPFHFINRQSL